MVAQNPDRPFGLTSADQPLGAKAPHAEHLLKVAGSISRDAAKVWSQMWVELTAHVTPSGVVLPNMQEGFVPSCGWPEFLESFWLLKHYLDSIQRVSTDTH